MVGNLRERGHNAFALGGLIVLWTLCPFLAGRFESQLATASAARWSVAIFLLVISFVYAFARKSALSKRGRDFATTRVVVILVTLVPLILLTLSPVIDFINYVPARGPQSGIFRAMGSAALYGVPLILAAAAFGIHAVRERSPVFAFTAGLIVNLTVTTVLLVAVAGINGAMNRVVLVNALQLNAIAAACVALVWMASRPWWARNPDAPDGSERVLLIGQKWIAIGLVALLISPIALHLIVVPHSRESGNVCGRKYQWLAGPAPYVCSRHRLQQGIQKTGGRCVSCWIIGRSRVPERIRRRAIWNHEMGRTSCSARRVGFDRVAAAPRERSTPRRKPCQSQNRRFMGACRIESGR